MNAPAFVIETGIDIPVRQIASFAPRQSKYPVDQLQEGQAFAVPVEDEKEARRKQSQFSGLAKTRGIKLITRYFGPGEESPFASVQAPCLGVWHGGKADPTSRKRRAKNAAAQEEGPQDGQLEYADDGAANEDEEEEGVLTL